MIENGRVDGYIQLRSALLRVCLSTRTDGWTDSILCVRNSCFEYAASLQQHPSVIAAAHLWSSSLPVTTEIFCVDTNILSVWKWMREKLHLECRWKSFNQKAVILLYSLFSFFFVYIFESVHHMNKKNLYIMSTVTFSTYIFFGDPIHLHISSIRILIFQ